MSKIGAGSPVFDWQITSTAIVLRRGEWYYRLKQNDLDGTIHCSDPGRIFVTTGSAVPQIFSLSQLPESLQSQHDDPLWLAQQVTRDAIRLQHPRPAGCDAGDRRPGSRLSRSSVRRFRLCRRSLLLQDSIGEFCGDEETHRAEVTVVPEAWHKQNSPRKISG